MPNVEDVADGASTPLDTQSPFSSGSGAQPRSPQPHSRACVSIGPGIPDTMSPIPIDADDLDPSDDEVTARITLTKRLEDVSIYAHEDHFLGKSSSLMFLNTAFDMKKEYVNSPSDSATGTPELSAIAERASAIESSRPVLQFKRPEFWNDKVCIRTRYVTKRVPMLMGAAGRPNHGVDRERDPSHLS